MKESFRISNCPSAMRAEALRVLHDGLSAEDQAALVLALDLARGQDASVFDELLIAESDGHIVGATWVQLMPGDAAQVWPPLASSRAATSLMQAVDHVLEKRKVGLAQVLVSPTATADEDLLATAGFQRLVDLAYLTAGRESFPARRPQGPLQFLPRAVDEPRRLAALVERTYEGTLDCPGLNGRRSLDSVLASYRAQGEFVPERWYFVTLDGDDVGVLILAVHAGGENWELVYMGVVPEHRRRGWGRAIIQFVLHEAGRGGAERVVLAVDEQNGPGQALYRAAGFVPWDRRRVYARLRDSSAG